MITVSFCCNDPDNGLPLFKVCAIEIHVVGAGGIELEGPHYPDDGNTFREVEKPKDAPHRCDRGFKLGRYIFPCSGWTNWYGNWCWDATRMTGVDVLVLLRTLRKLGWRCVSSESAFFEAYQSGAEITPTLVHEALS